MPAGVTLPIRAFRGLDESQVAPVENPGISTRTLDNVEMRFGKVKARQGVALYLSIDDAHGVDENISGLLEYRKPDLSNIIVRVGPTTVERLNAGGTAWDVITGTALTGAATNLVMSTVMDDVLAFTNGVDLPRRYNGTGDTVEFADTTIPYAKTIASNLGFMFLGNISEDGTFSDLTNGPLTIRYSDDPYASDGWTTCAGNQLVLDQTPGEIRAMRFLGRTLLVYKSDAVIAVNFVGGAVQFAMQKLPFDKGIIAPLSLAEIGAKGHVFLGTDQELYATNGSTFEPLPPNLSTTLQETLAVADAEVCVAAVMPDDETYNLFYPRTASVVPNGRLIWNFRSGEFSKYSYAGHNFSRVLGTRRSNTTANVLLGTDPADDNVWQLDTGQDDNGTLIDSFYTTDWNDFGIVGDKWITGATLQFKANDNTRAEVSIAKNFDPTWKFSKMYDLSGRRLGSTQAAEELLRVKYTIPPQYGEVFNIRIRLFNDGATNRAELQSMFIHLIPKSETFRNNKDNYSAGADRTTSA
jgi:hypothetical protein